MDSATEFHILAIGEALTDIVIPTSHPEDAREVPGGSPASVAVILGRLGCSAVLSTWFADGERGRLIEEYFTASRVIIAPESRGAQRTTTATAMIDEKGAATCTFDFDWNLTPPILVSGMTSIVHAGSIPVAVEPGANVVSEAVKNARPHALTTFDPNTRPTVMGDPDNALKLVERLISISDVIKVSDGDIAWLTGGAEPESVIEKWFSMGPCLIIVTRGKKGGPVVPAPGIRYEATPGEVKAVDTVGAGDSFMGETLDVMWGLGLVGTEGHSVLENIGPDAVKTILDHASKVSDATVSRADVDPPWADELD